MYYTIVNGGLLTAENEQALTNYYDNVQPLPTDYEQGKYIVVDNQLVLNEHFEEEKAQAEKERIAKLHLTRGDVFRGLLKARGVTKVQLREMIELLPETTPEEIQIKELAKIDFEDSLDFYRGVPIVDIIGQQLGITSKQLDKFFETNDYTKLLPVEEPTVPTEPTTEPNIQ